MSNKSVILVVLDGWGINLSKAGNAVAAARAPIYNSLLRDHPHTQLQASGELVGLPEGQMGNSEVGHLNLGAGRIVYQDITRISKSIRDGDFFRNPALVSAMETAQKDHASLHLLGLLSDCGVHSHIDHILAMFDLAKAPGNRPLDGEDLRPRSLLARNPGARDPRGGPGRQGDAGVGP